MKGYVVDPQTNIVKECYAVVYAPKRRRTRFPENVVEVCDTETVALQKADHSNMQYAAKLVGPCRSSEGFMVFFLKEWLNLEPEE